MDYISVRKDLVCDKKFLELSLQSQAFYFQLLVNCDGNDLVSNYRSLRRASGVSEFDILELEKNNFIKYSNEGIYILKK